MAVPSPLRLNDVVPALRGDLVFDRPVWGPGDELVHVRAIGWTTSTAFKGYELSLARLLDGHRRARQVVDAAQALGLPLSLEGLEGFVHRLDQHGLLARTWADAATGLSPFPARLVWGSHVREPYRRALKALREDELEVARAELEGLLAAAPQLEEAQALRRWLDAHAPRGQPSVREAFVSSERHWRALVGAPPAGLRAFTPPGSFGPLLWLLGVLSLAVLVFLVPLPQRVSVPAELSAQAVRPVSATQAGAVQQVRVRDGDWVAPGDVLLVFREPGRPPLRAPGQGRVTGLAVRPGAEVGEGQPVLLLEDTRRLEVHGRADAKAAGLLRQGQRATVKAGPARARARVEGVAGEQLLSNVDNADGRLRPGPALVRVEVGPRSLAQRLSR